MKNRFVLAVAFALTIMTGYGQEFQGSFRNYISRQLKDDRGKEMVEIIVPGMPPERKQPVAPLTRNAVVLNHVPAFDWSYGCSTTAAAMAAGYYDNNGYPNMYAGPANYGFMMMDNSFWGYIDLNGENRAQCPLSATMNGLDGRTSRGHVDDYWIQSGNTGPDPFIANGWQEHTAGDCTGDFMKTNQSAFNNSDGSTMFVYYTDGSPFIGTEPGDGCYGLKLFYESRGYVVQSFYNQYIEELENVPYGFTFEQYKQEINNGRPVLIQVAGHTMLGFGYDNDGSLVYLHDTWDYSNHTMVWGTEYSGMEHYGVSVVQLQPAPAGIVANFTSNARVQLINTPVELYDWSYGNPTAWQWSISPSTYQFTGGTGAGSQNPKIQFTAPGAYSITLTASKTGYQDSEIRAAYIEAVVCGDYPFPYQKDFSEKALPLCWQIVDHIGNGQVWHFNNPHNWSINTSTAYNGFAMLDSDNYGDGGSQNTDLVTPGFDFSDYSVVNLYFEHYFKEWPGSSGTLSYSVNGGNTWNVIQSWSSETDNPAVFNQNVSAQVAGHANVKFKWNYTGSYGYFWTLDDINISGTLAGQWTGAVSTSWNNTGNWLDGIIPSGTTKVTIPASAAHWPVYNGNITIGVNCGDITLEGASQLTINGNLTIPAGKNVQLTGDGLLKVKGTVSR